MPTIAVMAASPFIRNIKIMSEIDSMKTDFLKSSFNRATSWSLTLISLCCFVSQANSAELHSEDFNGDDGGYVATLFNPLNASSPENFWTWGATGVGGSNAWTATGASVGTPFEQHLDIPSISVTGTGLVILEFDHLYKFEATWDGGVVMYGVNGGPLSPVPAAAFTSNGYNDLMQSGSDWGYDGDMNGLDMFGVDSGGFVHSIANLGTLNAGDTLDIQFRGGWDWNTLEPEGWTIDNVVVTQLETPGDFNFDESLDLLDFGILASNFNEPGQFSDGDINIDGMVNMTDFVEWYQLYRAQEDPAGAASVPEPTTGLLLLFGCIGLLCKSRRRRN